MWQTTWNVIHFECPLVEQKFMNKPLVVSICPFAMSSVELPNFLQRNSKMIQIYLNVCETRPAKKLEWDEWFTPCLLNSPGEFKLASFLEAQDFVTQVCVSVTKIVLKKKFLSTENNDIKQIHQVKSPK
jgi:hypothetical protein